MLKFLPQIIIFICVLASTLIYIKGIMNNTVKPILATRVFLLLAFLLSAITSFKQTGLHGLMPNMLNLVDFLSVLATFFAMAMSKNENREFTNFEKFCLYFVILIFLIWIITKQNILANILIQIILVIAYLPTLIHLWKAQTNTESLGAWSLDFCASIFGMIAPFQTMELLPLIYGIRSTISTFTVIIFTLCLKHKEEIIKEKNYLIIHSHA